MHKKMIDSLISGTPSLTLLCIICLHATFLGNIHLVYTFFVSDLLNMYYCLITLFYFVIALSSIWIINGLLYSSVLSYFDISSLLFGALLTTTLLGFCKTLYLEYFNQPNYGGQGKLKFV